MTKEDLKTNEGLRVYIDSLMTGEPMPCEEWRAWIKKESEEYGERHDEEDIDFIVSILEEKGFVKE